MPAFIEPQLCRAAWRNRPSGPGWAHEIKFDGYRMQLRIEGGKARLFTRKGLDWSDKFPEIVAAGAQLADGIIDGEVVALDHNGAPDFAALQAALSDGKTETWSFFVFDQLFAGGEDLRPLPLSRRKERLQATVADAPPQHPLRRPLRHRRRCRAAVGLPDGIWKASSPSGWTRPIVRPRREPGPSPNAAPATRW